MNTRSTLLAAILLAGTSPLALAQAQDWTPETLLDRMYEAHGGDAVDGIRSLEFETVGYFHGRYQSRHTTPPWDLIPIRQYTAIDFESPRAVRDVLSAWPGGLTMGYRSIIDGDTDWHLNTIARFYERGTFNSYNGTMGSVRVRFPVYFVQSLVEDPSRVSSIGQETRSGMDYITLVYDAGSTMYVNPETFLIDSVEYRSANHMVGREVDYRRAYDNYTDIGGIMVPQRYLMWVEGLPYYDLSLPTVRFNTDISRHLEIPDNFAEVAASDAYSGQMEIGVREVADGVFAAGNGETQILYVEFDEYFVAMETGGFPSYAENVHAAMEPYMDGKPLRYIVPTHYHDDHLFAVHYYARIGATILTTRDKEGYIRELLNRTWDEHGPVTDAAFEYIDGPVRTFADGTNRFDVHVYADAPHTENMLVGYVEGSGILFSGDTVIGWVQPEPGIVRQGAPYAALHLDQWVRERQAAGEMGAVSEYVNVHGVPYSPAEWRQMLATERTFTTLPDNEAMPVLTWFERYGLNDNTTSDPDLEIRHGARATN